MLDEIENELTQEFEFNDQSQIRARQAIERSLTLSTPVRRFYERYRDGNDEKIQELFDDWRLRFLNRAKNDPEAKNNPSSLHAMLEIRCKLPVNGG